MSEEKVCRECQGRRSEEPGIMGLRNHVILCPKHALAEELAEALEETLRILPQVKVYRVPSTGTPMCVLLARWEESK